MNQLITGRSSAIMFKYVNYHNHDPLPFLINSYSTSSQFGAGGRRPDRQSGRNQEQRGAMNDMYRPSFFEMVAQDRLICGLKPALTHIFTIIVRRFPRLDALLRYNEEIFSSMLYFLEKHYLREYDGSFSENFYGLRRVSTPASLQPDSGTYPSRALSRRAQRTALFFLVLFPYMKSRLDKFYTNSTSLVDEDGFSRLPVPPEERLFRCLSFVCSLVTLYPGKTASIN